MTTLREIISTLIFIAGIVLSITAFNAFNWGTLAAAMLCFISAYFIWPSKRRGQRHSDNRFIDMLEVCIELPVEIFVWIFRLIGRLFRSGESGINIDL